MPRQARNSAFRPIVAFLKKNILDQDNRVIFFVTESLIPARYLANDLLYIASFYLQFLWKHTETYSITAYAISCAWVLHIAHA